MLIATASGLALRLLLLGHKSLWLDEVLGLVTAQADPRRLLSGMGERYHPPLYYLLLRPWLHIASTQYLLRLPSAILGALTPPLLYAATKKLFDEDVARTALWLAVLSPLLVWYSQELRSYSLLVVLAAIATLALIRLAIVPTAGWWLLFTASMIAALYTHYDTVLLVPAQAVLVTGMMARGRATGVSVVAWVLGLGATALAISPWLATPAASDFLQIFTSDKFYTAPLLQRTLGIQYSQALPYLGVAAVLAIVATCVAIWLVLRRYHSSLPRLRASRWVRTFAFIAFAVLLILAIIPRGYTLKRHMLILWPFALVAFAWLWPWTSSRRTERVAILGLSVVAALVNVTAIPKAQWQDVARYVSAEQHEGDAIVLSPAYMRLPYEYYASQQMPVVTVQTTAVDATLSKASGQYQRLWFVYHTTDIDTYRPAIESWLDENATRLNSMKFFRVQVELYQPK